MSYVMISADFPDVDTAQRNAIYECLKNEKWQKVTEFGRDITTIWYVKFKDHVSEASAIQISVKHFQQCAQPYYRPKLVIHWGPNKPTFHGLT